MAETIFSKIIAGEIPCHRVYEDERVLAFLDIGPQSEGHTLVIPKEPAETIDGLSAESAAALGRALVKVCAGVQKATGCAGYNLLQNNGSAAGQEVMHVHFHVIPRYTDRDGQGLRVTWKPRAFDHAQGAELAKRIGAAIG